MSHMFFWKAFWFVWDFSQWMEEFVKGEKFDNFLNVDLTCTENESKCISDKVTNSFK